MYPCPISILKFPHHRDSIQMNAFKIHRLVLSLVGISITFGFLSGSHGFCVGRRRNNNAAKLPVCSLPRLSRDSNAVHVICESSPLRTPLTQNGRETSLRWGPTVRLNMASFSNNRRGMDEKEDEKKNAATPPTDWGSFALFSSVGFLYWYLMVFGAAAHANGLPVPDFIPMTPGWPATDADFAPVLEDSYHFFYLSELLHNEDAPYVIPPRLAIFNFVEAWIFAMLPVLWKDTRRRLPRPILLGSWLLLGINLTNAFLAPYLAITELRGSAEEEEEEGGQPSNNSLMTLAFPRVFGAIATTVVGYALYQSTIVATSADWSEFWGLVQTDRSYLAFCVDPVLFAIFQPLILARVKSTNDATDYVPFVGLITWLFSTTDVDSE